MARPKLSEEEKKASLKRKKELEKIWKSNNKDKEIIYRQKHNKKHPNSSKIRNKKYNEKNPGRQYMLYKKHILKKYDLTLEDYNNMLLEQKECCVICGNHQSLSTRSLHVDHDHKTGKVRGLLCSKCNRGLGMFTDNTEYLQNAINYLNKFKN